MAFWNRKKTKTPEPSKNNSSKQSPQIAAMLKVINKEAVSDPTIRAKMTGKDITAITLDMLKDDRGVRVESALGILGSLAGASCSYAMADHLVRNPSVGAPEIVLTRVQSGERLMFGNYLNRKLVEGEMIGPQPISLWYLLAGISQQHLGEIPQVDLPAIFKRVIAQGGTPEFGTIDVPKEHLPGDLPQNFVAKLFPQFRPVLERYELPRDQYWLAFAFSAQELLGMGKDTADLTIMSQLTMECAIFASKLDMSQYLPSDRSANAANRIPRQS